METGTTENNQAPRRTRSVQWRASPAAVPPPSGREGVRPLDRFAIIIRALFGRLWRARHLLAVSLIKAGPGLAGERAPWPVARAHRVDLVVVKAGPSEQKTAARGRHRRPSELSRKQVRLQV